jgi:hypothetical protein
MRHKEWRRIVKLPKAMYMVNKVDPRKIAKGYVYGQQS